jgi:DNA polymerase III delta prime subunit
MKRKLIIDFSYPEPENNDIQSKIFKKREFYYHQVQSRKKLETYEEIKDYRDEICEGELKLRNQQAILGNLINPHTPYKGLLMMHGTGTGKTCAAIAIAEQFKDQVKKYNTKIYILTFGPNGRETFKSELLNCTADTYLKNNEILNQLSKAEVEVEKKIAINSALQYYKILSYKSFHKKVLGEKIVEKKLDANKKIKLSYRKNEEGDFEREIIVDRINTMNNTILIVDEAHNLTGNDQGEALRKIIKNSENLRVILLTATPMKNKADDIIDLLNFIRPQDDPISRDHVFLTGDKNHLMTIKDGGLEYLKEKVLGYVSYFRGNIPYVFAKRVDKGVISKGLLFTPVIKCIMNDFQYIKYAEVAKKIKDSLDRAPSSAANFVFPGLNKEKNDIVGYYSNDGINAVINQLEVDASKLKSLINKKLFDNKLSKEEEDNFLVITENKSLSGNILKKKFLKFFSIKFYKAIKRLDKLFSNKSKESNKTVGTAFVYSNLVKAGGMEIFAEALIQNGYLEYNENPRNYDIKDDTLDYKTGIVYSEFKKNNKINEFKPATFILITGSADESGEDIPEIKQKLIREVFNNVDNIDGKYIKLCLGSKVMNEGVTLANIKEIHILDVHYNLGKVEQVIGRGIRMCKHQQSINDDNRFPKVNIYRYVVGIPNKEQLSTDEILYQKAELKFLLVKKIEQILKESAIDCPLLYNGNIFPEELEKYKNCVYPTLENVEAGKNICPALCNFTDCNFKCSSSKLNDKYFNEQNISYKLANDNEIDYNTFNDDLARFEINLIKQKIKDLYRFKHIYLYEEMLEEIKKSFLPHQSSLFNKYFLDQAIEDMLPQTPNDFNNFKDYVYDKYNQIGYLIHRDKYYIFQKFDENEDITMFYRQNLSLKQPNLVSIENYIKQKYGDIKLKDTKENEVYVKYNFEDVLEYYDEREENFIVGIIDYKDNEDIFKIREKIQNIADRKKRSTGIPTLTGAVCFTAKNKKYILKILDKLEINNIEEIKKKTKENICNVLKEKLLYLEKYSTSKEGNKKTYIMIPSNHKLYPFPYNLEDRTKDRIKKINKLAGREINIVVKKKDLNYILTFTNEKYLDKIHKELETLGCVLKDKQWTLTLD